MMATYQTYPPPPYAGAAPPVPAGISVNPQQWQAGYWHYNPAWNQNQNSKRQHVPWIPSNQWVPNQQQQTSHNPYKRVPRPPSAEYLATQLSDNPLGLSGLDEPNKHYDHLQTPWVWRPRELDDDDADGSPESSSPGSFTARRELQPTFSINIVRTPEHYRRHSSGSNRSNSIDSPNSSAGPILGDHPLSDEPASILSPLIISHTPKPGSSPLRGLKAHATYPLIGSGLESIPEGTDPRPSLNKSKDRRPALVTHSSSLPNTGLGSKYTTFIEPHQPSSPASPSSHSTHSSRRSLPSPASHSSPPSSYSPRPSPPQGQSPVTKAPKRTETPLILSKIPLPPPPSLHQSNNNNNNSYLPIRSASQQSYDNRRRHGYWNRRGDHLTDTGYVVHAPHDQQFPHELRNYPAEDEGYENHDGIFTAFVPRPDLPETIPKNGKPGIPYHHFVIYHHQ